jgi:cps2J
MSNNSKYLISFIVPVFNTGTNIENIVNSILKVSSTMDNILEIIVVDDGSDDQETLDSLKNISKLNDVSVIRQKNSGPSASRNIGISNTSGEWIGFCDSDDIIDSEHLLNTVKTIKMNNYKNSDMLVFGWSIRHNQDNKSTYRHINLEKQSITGENDIAQKTLKSLSLDGRMYNLWNRLYRKNIIRDNNIKLDENLRFGEDLIFNLNFLLKSSRIDILDVAPYYTYISNSETSIVKTTKLNTEYRIKNARELDKFSKIANQHDNPYVQLVKARWLISFIMSSIQYSIKQEGYKKSLNNVKRMIDNRILAPKFIKKTPEIGIIKYILLLIATLILKNALLTFILANILLFIKNIKSQKNTKLDEKYYTLKKIS